MRARGLARWPLMAGALVALAVVVGVVLVNRDSAARPPAEEPVAALPIVQSQPGRVFLSAQDARRGAEAGLLPEGARSILDVDRTLHHGEFRWDDAGVPAGPLDVRVDLDRQLISVFRGGHEIGVAVALYGMDGKPTPQGRFPIKAKLEDYRSRTYDAPMPYSLWLTDDGVAVHGSKVRGGRATNGCVGVPIDFARLLFEQASVGDVVEIVAAGARTG